MVSKLKKKMDKVYRTSGTLPCSDQRCFAHIYKSSSVSATKSNIAASIQKETMAGISTTKYPYRIWKKLQKKTKSIEKLMLVLPMDRKTTMSYNEIESKRIFYECFYDDPTLEDLLEKEKLSYEIKNVYLDLQIIDNKEGSKLMESDFVPIYIHPPRLNILRDSPMNAPSADVDALRQLVRKHKARVVRGKKRTGLSYEYATLGLASYQGKPGLGMKIVRHDCVHQYNHLIRMKGRIERFAKEYLPFRVLTSHSRARENCNDSHTMDPKRPVQRVIWSSVASAILQLYVSSTYRRRLFFVLHCHFI